jgi:hypothetical protein
VILGITNHVVDKYLSMHAYKGFTPTSLFYLLPWYLDTFSLSISEIYLGYILLLNVSVDYLQPDNLPLLTVL